MCTSEAGTAGVGVQGRDQTEALLALEPTAILTAEFEYIAQTAFQANEDRARVTNFYLITLAGFVAAILGTQFEKLAVPQVHYAFAVLFIVLALASLLTVLQLVRLRQAWFESVSAMNRLKAYYIGQFPDLHLRDAFAWDIETLPARFKPWSVGFLLALQTGVLGGVCLGAAVIFLGLAGSKQAIWLWWPAVLVAVIWATTQMILYWQALKTSRAGL